MASPDITPYVNLTLYDQTAQTLYDAAVAQLQTDLPEWTPREGNTEVYLLEALALMVAESVFAINRLPAATTEILAKLFGIERDPGGPPTTTLTFTMAGTVGYTIPAGTKARLPLTNNRYMVFTTDTTLVIAPGNNSGTVAATGDLYTDEANGVDATVIQLIDSLLAVNAVTIASAVTGGHQAEDDLTYFSRATLRFSRVTDSLVRAEDFEVAVLEQPLIFTKAKALDDWTPETIPTPTITDVTNADTGGTLGDGTYSYRVSAINADGETLASVADSVVVATATGTNLVTVTWATPTVPGGVSAITGYNIYGRSAGTELLMDTVGLVNTWDDDGSAAPSGALPAENTTGPALGDAPGHITVATYGVGALNTTDEKNDIETELATMALANLAVHVIDPTITSVDVTVTVTAQAGYTAAEVQTAVEEALEAYLDPTAWDWGTTVYVNELISLIDQVEGVDRVVTLAAPAADTPLDGYATLAEFGTITVTVS